MDIFWFLDICHLAHLSPHFVIIVDIIVGVLHTAWNPLHLHLWERFSCKLNKKPKTNSHFEATELDLCPYPLPLSEWLEQALFETLHKVWPILSPQESSSLHTVQPKNTPWFQFPFCSFAEHKQSIINKKWDQERGESFWITSVYGQLLSFVDFCLSVWFSLRTLYGWQE